MVLIGMLYTPFTREAVVPLYRTKVFFASVRLALVFLALVAASYAIAPDWMWMYYLAADEVSVAGLIYVAVVLYLLPYFAGLFLGQQLSALSFRAWELGVAGCVFLQMALLVGWWQRYSQVGTMEEFFSGAARSLTSAQPLGTILNAGTVVLVAIAWWQWRSLRKSTFIHQVRQSGSK